MAVKASSRPSLRHASSGLGVCDASDICSLKEASMPSKRFASSGSCSRMSSEPKKMDSRLHHCRCTSTHASSVARTPPSLAFQPATALSKKSTKRFESICCTEVSCSSSAS